MQHTRGRSVTYRGVVAQFDDEEKFASDAYKEGVRAGMEFTSERLVLEAEERGARRCREACIEAAVDTAVKYASMDKAELLKAPHSPMWDDVFSGLAPVSKVC